jgi:hypothetical protein
MGPTKAKGAIARRFLDRAATLSVCLVFLLELAAPHGHAQNLDGSKQKVVQDLVAIKTRQEATSWDQLAEPLVSAARASNPSAPPETWEELRSYINGVILNAAAQPGGPTELIIRRYNDRFTDDEIRQLLAFFSSDVGKKFTVESSVLRQDLDKANAMFMMRLVPQITRDVERFFQERGLRMPR